MVLTFESFPCRWSCAPHCWSPMSLVTGSFLYHHHLLPPPSPPYHPDHLQTHSSSPSLQRSSFCSCQDREAPPSRAGCVDPRGPAAVALAHVGVIWFAGTMEAMGKLGLVCLHGPGESMQCCTVLHEQMGLLDGVGGSNT